ncbi:hypothetical protein BGW38_009707 [Lunasporangiospora selenospora]|uniref:Matrin-type domain-containing protein n=1 Tax=Lunasporangiospora selenospora TaxID=979761 RepID=A0A9P6G2B7_9FUNG|nr:hypothetical protein BGW38_009707 [Lunasporangiospora selenospora]
MAHQYWTLTVIYDSSSKQPGATEEMVDRDLDVIQDTQPIQVQSVAIPEEPLAEFFQSSEDEEDMGMDQLPSNNILQRRLKQSKTLQWLCSPGAIYKNMVDRQNRVGSKIGSAGVAGASESNVDRRERLRRLALETIDLAKDPYFMRNHLGSYECKLCLTLHTNEGSYLAHTQGKKHQTNLGRRAAKDAMEKPDAMTPLTAQQQQALKAGSTAPTFKRNIIKIGRPGYTVTKIRDPASRQFGLLFEVDYPEIAQDVEPRFRFMSAYEQQVQAPNKAHQYLVIAAEPYETISFKIQSREVDRAEEKLWSHWDVDRKRYTMQFFFKNDQRMLSSSRMESAPGYAPGTGSGSGTQMANPLNPFHAPMRTAA